MADYSDLKIIEDIWRPISEISKNARDPDWLDAIEWAKEIIRKCNQEFNEI